MVTVGVLVLWEQGGDVGSVHDQHVPGEDLLLGHDVTTFSFGELHLRREARLKIEQDTFSVKIQTSRAFDK